MYLMCAGLYGRHLPQTVANFLTLVKSGAYQGTAISKVLLQAGLDP
jgi:cyclophilin family peptidyl-prolyl cis-trans isomerase